MVLQIVTELFFGEIGENLLKQMQIKLHIVLCLSSTLFMCFAPRTNCLCTGRHALSMFMNRAYL